MLYEHRCTLLAGPNEQMPPDILAYFQMHVTSNLPGEKFIVMLFLIDAFRYEEEMISGKDRIVESFSQSRL